MSLPLAWLFATAVATGAAACSFEAKPFDPGGELGDDVPPDGEPVDPTGDPDGDGVPNASDNCPDAGNTDQTDGDTDGVGDACDNCAAVSNPRRATMGAPAPIQRDHDADGRGDECDLCPHIASTTPDLDIDGDGIGAACDPELTMANPAPYWNGFYEEPGSDWIGVPGAGAKDDWELARLPDGRLGWRQTVLDESRRQILLDQARQEHFLQTSAIVEEIAPRVATGLRSASLTYSFGPFGNGDDGYYGCGIRHDLDATSNINQLLTGAYREDFDDTNEGEGTAPWLGTYAGATIALTGRADRAGGTQPNSGRSSLACSAAAGAVTAATTFSSQYIPDGRIGLRTYGVRAWFDYLFAVEPRPRP